MTKNKAAARGVISLVVVAVTACTGGEVSPADGGTDPGAAEGSGAAVVFEREIARIGAAAARLDSVFQPLPLLAPSEEEELRRYLNAQQLARARELGVGRALAADSLAALRASGALVTLEDSDYWILRDLDYSAPLVIPQVRELLTAIGERFHRRLADLGAPPLRMEITSVLRSAEDQAALRRVNPNAASGESTHEYGTTIDVLYSAYAAPPDPIVALEADEAPTVEPLLRWVSEIAVERVAGRRSLELKAILGEVLLEMQREGRVMVTLERQQPVYHMTVAR
ncbi:MAG: DUF5715 family protein [Gemmatimonadota bacterium]